MTTFGCSMTEPSNFEDCVLEHVKSDQNVSAVNAIRTACRAKFPLENFSTPASPPTTNWRDAFALSTSQSCFKTQRSDPLNKEMPDTKISYYCSCVGSRMSKLVNERDVIQMEKNRNIDPIRDSLTVVSGHCVDEMHAKGM